jgi:hypothetical protein
MVPFAAFSTDARPSPVSGSHGEAGDPLVGAEVMRVRALAALRERSGAVQLLERLDRDWVEPPEQRAA